MPRTDGYLPTYSSLGTYIVRVHSLGTEYFEYHTSEVCTLAVASYKVYFRPRRITRFSRYPTSIPSQPTCPHTSYYPTNCLSTLEEDITLQSGKFRKSSIPTYVGSRVVSNFTKLKPRRPGLSITSWDIHSWTPRLQTVGIQYLNICT